MTGGAPTGGSRARVVLLGAGGLGCAAAPVLARAAASRPLHVVIADGDRVEIGNLHRQVMHRAEDAGRRKARSMERALEAIARAAGAAEGALTTEAWCERIAGERARELVRGADVVLDGTDNFATRFLANDACVLEGVRLVHAASIRWQGQLLGVAPREGGPCYRCLFEEPPGAAAGMTCAEAGVAGPVVGVVGALAAELALALLDGRSPYQAAPDGTRLGRLLTYDGLRGQTRTVRFRRNPSCIACGQEPLAALLPHASYEVPAC